MISTSGIAVNQCLAQALNTLVDHGNHGTLGSELVQRFERDVLENIREYLSASFMIQKTMSTELTPAVSRLIPIYWDYSELLELIKQKHTLLCHSVRASMDKLDKYLATARHNKLCAIAICASIWFAVFMLD